MQDAHDYQGAYAVLSEALADEPDSPELLYDVAMVAEKLDRLDEVESRLKARDRAQARQRAGPERARLHAGRSHAAHRRGHEAHREGARAGASDPFILDSMGWAHFRLGNLSESEKFLRRALAERPDPEIAAHLGEVLWAKGERDHAQEVWQSQLKETPDNPVLLDTVHRLAH